MKNINSYNIGDEDERPWGSWKVTDVREENGQQICIKEITVAPQGILSLQSHMHREEFWTIISGEAEVTINDISFSAIIGQEVHIPVRAKHRVKNIGQKPLVFQEKQRGNMLSENDIIRYSDTYNRS